MKNGSEASSAKSFFDSLLDNIWRDRSTTYKVIVGTVAVAGALTAVIFTGGIAAAIFAPTLASVIPITVAPIFSSMAAGISALLAPLGFGATATAALTVATPVIAAVAAIPVAAGIEVAVEKAIVPVKGAETQQVGKDSDPLDELSSSLNSPPTPEPATALPAQAAENPSFFQKVVSAITSASAAARNGPPQQPGARSAAALAQQQGNGGPRIASK